MPGAHDGAGHGTPNFVKALFRGPAAVDHDIVPVMKLAASEQRKQASAPISTIFPQRPAGWLAKNCVRLGCLGHQRGPGCVYLGLEPETQRRIYLNRTVPGSFRSTQQYLNSKIAEREQGGELASVTIPLDQYFDSWLELAALPKLRTKSLLDYRSLPSRYIRPALGEPKLRDLATLNFQSVFHQVHQIL